MKTNVVQEKSYEKKVDFELTVEEMDAFGKKAFDKVRKSVSVNGFRKGKAPVSIVKRMYDKSAARK